jgi:ankyrin repeat protein
MPYALHEAAERGQLGELVKLLVLGHPEQPIDVHARNAAGETPLHAAVRSGRLDAVMFLLCNGADVNAAAFPNGHGLGGLTPLHIACSQGDSQVTRLLLLNGADVNARASVIASGGGETPLHLAADKGHHEIAQILLSNGADPNAANALGLTPWSIASRNGYLAIADELASHGAQPWQAPAMAPALAEPKSPKQPEPAPAPIPAQEPVTGALAPETATPGPALPEHRLPDPKPAPAGRPHEADVRPSKAGPTVTPPLVPPRVEPRRLGAKPPPLPPSTFNQATQFAVQPAHPSGPSGKPKAAARGGGTPQVTTAATGPGLDPTLNWHTYDSPIPDFDVLRMQFGTLRFGDGLQGASFLGRPDRFVQKEADHFELLYARRGFQLEFEKNRFTYLAFFIGPDACLPQHVGMRFSSPRFRGDSLSRDRLTRETERATLERTFGTPDSVDADSEEIVLRYLRHGITMEFELDARTGRLKRWNIYSGSAK